jgi:enamine deaminase RidA (YjgF/YER057c/UK114 family)
MERLIFVSGQVDCDQEARFATPGIWKPSLPAPSTIWPLPWRPRGQHEGSGQRPYLRDRAAAEHTARIREIRSAWFDAETPPAVSLLGVERLAFDGLRVEIEAMAAV